MSGSEKILIAEVEDRMRSFLAALMASQKYDSISADTGGAAVALTALHTPDLILLNPELPDMDGLNVLRQVRQWTDVPVIILTARQSEQDLIEALDSGANDYVTKPFGTGELLARIRSAIRIYRRVVMPDGTAGTVYRNGGLVIDFEKRVVMVGESAVHLTPIEYKIIALFARNTGKVLTHDYIIQQLWGAYAGDSQLLRVNIANLRRKLEENPSSPRYITTEVGVGYRLREANL